MITADLLHRPFLPLAETHRLISDVPKKLIRNLTDREIILLTGSRDPRLYTLLNCMELALLHTLTDTDTGYYAGKLMCRGLLARVEQRCEQGTVGTINDMKVMGCLITRNEHAESTLHTFFRSSEEIGDALKLWLDDGFRGMHVIAVDAIIEDVLSRYLKRAEA